MCVYSTYVRTLYVYMFICMSMYQYVFMCVSFSCCNIVDTSMYIIIIIIIISYFNWVAISLRLLLRPPVSPTLAHTHNQIKSYSNCLVAAVGNLLSCFQVGGRGV